MRLDTVDPVLGTFVFFFFSQISLEETKWIARQTRGLLLSPLSVSQRVNASYPWCITSENRAFTHEL